VIVLALATIAALALAEGLVRTFDLDWRLIENLLYYNGVDPPSLQVDENPLLLYRLKPGRTEYDGYAVGVNALGARGQEHNAIKPPGVFRIVCVGASNVYGHLMNDEQTWPAQLEAQFNAESPGRYEVWNFGTPGYVAAQMAVIAREAVSKLKPDLVVFAPSNMGPRPFLLGRPVKPLFAKNEQLWRDLFAPRAVDFPPLVSYERKLCWIERSRLYRYFAAWRVSRSRYGWGHDHETQNWKSAREFFAWAKERTRVCGFIYPGVPASQYDTYFKNTGVPVLELRADDKPPIYREIHPTAEVYAWYGQEIAHWLRAQKLVPSL